jgi:hypothetical protein
MTDNFLTKLTPTNANFFPTKLVDIYPHDPNTGFKLDSIVLPPLSQLPSYYSIQPRSSVAQQPITNSPIVDFTLQDPDYITNTYAQITLTNTTGTAVNLRSYLLFNRLEILDSNNNIMTTIYQNAFLDKFLYLNQLQINRLAPSEGFNATNFAPTQIPANSSVNLMISIPGLAAQNAIKTSLINSGLYLRFYMQPNAIDTPASVNITNFNLVVFGARYFSKQQSYDTLQKIPMDLKYRYLTPVRALLTNSTLNAGQQYTFQLVSGSGLSAFLVLRIYDNVFNFATSLNYQPVANLQMNDKTNTIIGVNLPSVTWQSVVNKNFPGSILDYNVLNSNGYSNIYIIPFTINPVLSNSGSQLGMYGLTGLENVQFTMPTTGFTSGNYNIEVMSYNYACFEINKGNITSFVSE